MDNMDNSGIPGKDLGNKKFVRVVEGMKVYDRDNHEIGKVDRVYFGEVSQNAEERGRGASGLDRGASDTPGAVGLPPTGSPGGESTNIPPVIPVPEYRFTGNVQPASEGADLGGYNGDPVIKNRMLHDGFLRIDTGGLFGKHRFALPEQVADVTEDGVILRVKKDELLKG